MAKLKLQILIHFNDGHRDDSLLRTTGVFQQAVVSKLNAPVSRIIAITSELVVLLQSDFVQACV